MEKTAGDIMSAPVELIYFSATGTTRRILEAVARTLGPDEVIRTDLTSPGELETISSPEQGLAVIGVPVYAGRVAPPAAERLRKHVYGDGRPAALVVLYGNRDYEDALLELKDIAEDLGFIPVAGAAFIGEHSYSTPEKPVAEGRPDLDDEKLAEEYGRRIREKLSRGRPSSLPDLELPGNRPHREGTQPNEVAPETAPQRCVLCGECARSCPMGAITVTDEVVTEALKCVMCCACTRICPFDARSLTHERVEGFRDMLTTKFSARNEPELFV